MIPTSLIVKFWSFYSRKEIANKLLIITSFLCFHVIIIFYMTLITNTMLQINLKKWSEMKQTGLKLISSGSELIHHQELCKDENQLTIPWNLWEHF